MKDLLRIRELIYILVPFILSVQSSNYVEFHFEDGNVCPRNDREGKVAMDKQIQGAIVTNREAHFEVSGNFSWKCKFNIKSPSNTGIFAVIQKMKLRKNQITGECIDYIQFQRATGFNLFGEYRLTLKSPDYKQSPKFCGEYNAAADMNDQFNKSNEYYFVEDSNSLIVSIFIANKTVKSDQVDLKIAFTSFFKCNSQTAIYNLCGQDKCILKSFSSDEIVNCPYPAYADEDSNLKIGSNGLKPGSGLITKVIAGAVAGIFTMFIVFIIFLWISRKCNRCFNYPQHRTTSSHLRQMERESMPCVEDLSQINSTPSGINDKDLPPSYESLFPNS